ncbi:putative transcription factor NAM family [Helianthus annuus]|nr:putative transcription factor NAM family [Helianthus annuus]
MAVLLDSTPPAPPAASSLAHGFRIHPTDKELVRYYLHRKICSKSFRFDAISDIDVYKVEPWDLPGQFGCFCVNCFSDCGVNLLNFGVNFQNCGVTHACYVV